MVSRVSSTLFALLCTALTVHAHGYVDWLIVGGQNYTGYNPNTDPYTSPTPERIVRKIPGNGPVTDLSLIDVQCNGYTDGGFATAPAPVYATDVSPGSEVTFHWTTWPDSHMGPLITYLAKAPSDVTQWSPGSDAVWFKVAEQGKDADGKWAATDILIANNMEYKFTLPSTLEAGQYIMRHEIIALHAAYSYPGAQVYPSCSQIEITGDGSDNPPSDYLVSFPGEYGAGSSGIVYDAYTNTSAYPIPGPPLWTGA